MSQVQQLQELLNKADVSDDEIRGGVTLTKAGYQKVAARLGISLNEVKVLLTTLKLQLQDEHNAEVTTTESIGPRYAYEADWMGNLTIRDSVNSSEHYIGGSQAAHLLKSLEETRPDSREEQLLLQRACDEDVETLTEDNDTDDSFMAELRNDAGSYNFPWRAEGQHGTATAAYKGSARELKIQVISIRDADGEEFYADDHLKLDIDQQARDFIGRE